MFMRSYNDEFWSPKMRSNSKNNNEEDGVFYILDSLARNEIKRNNNYYKSYKEIQKDKMAINKKNCKNLTNMKSNHNNEHFQSSKTTTCLQKYCSQFKETDTQGCDLRNEFREIDHNTDADLESQKRTQLGLESSLIFISKIKQNKMGEGTPEKKSDANSSYTKCFKSRETPNSNRGNKIPRHINDHKIKNFQNPRAEFSDAYPNSDLSPRLKVEAYMNDDSYKFGYSETYIVVHRRKDSTISDCNKKIITTTLNKETVIPKKDQNTQIIFDEKCESVNMNNVIDHPSLQRKLSKYGIHFVEKSKECLRVEQTRNVLITEENLSKKCLTNKEDASASENVLSNISNINAKGSCNTDEASVTKTKEMNYLKSCHRDYSNMTKDERTRELKRIYGISLLHKSHSGRKVQHSVQNPEWVF